MIAQPPETDRRRAQSRTSTGIDVAYGSALSALAGFVIVGLTSGTTAWLIEHAVDTILTHP
jgi:hypothetical protein